MNQTMSRISDAVARASNSHEPFDRTISSAYGYRVVRTVDGTVQVCYRGTVVAAFSPSFSKVVLTTRGWRTVTTRRVINAALDGTRYQVFQRALDWYVWARDEQGHWAEQPFEEGMTLDLDSCPACVDRHLLPTRGRATVCGLVGVDATSEINDVTCPTCLAEHKATIEATIDKRTDTFTLADDGTEEEGEA